MKQATGEVLVSRLYTARDKANRAGRRMRPGATRARKTATRYTEDARDWVVPRVETARGRLGPALGNARHKMGPRLETARERVRDDVVPRVAEAARTAVVASEPIRDEAKSRGSAAIFALRGEIRPADIERVNKRKHSKRGGRHWMRKFFLFLGVGGAAAAAWSVWRRQNRPPEWVLEEGTEGERPVQSAPAFTDPTTTEQGAGNSRPSSADTAGATPDEMIADASGSDETPDTSSDEDETGNSNRSAKTQGRTASGGRRNKS